MSKYLQIKVDPNSLKGVVPGAALRSGHFFFKPADFAIGNDLINSKIITAESQIRGLQEFLDDPKYPWVYGVGASPEDSNAKYFAAFLVQEFMKKVPNSRVIWHPLYSNFHNPLLENDEACSLLVLTGLAPNSTAAKIDKCRDLLEHYNRIPRIVVTAGVDPITFFYSVLHQKLNVAYYHSKAIVKRKVEVV